MAGLSPEAIAYAQQFFQAARAGRADVLEAPLEAGLPPNLTNDKGDTLLMLAAYHGHVDAVKLLLKFRADPNRVNDRGQSPIAGAIFKNEEAVVEALLEGGADPDLGKPTGVETAAIFGQAQRWEEPFAQARERRAEREAQGTS
ncbi:hypothetical protein JCM10212_004901 [Sporobolomyces blumeae]